MKRSNELNTIINEVYSCYEVQYGNAIVDLIQRIDKAIEYIENNGDDIVYSYDLSKEKLDELLDILKGSDDNV